jgi:hypothetical protein
MSEQLHADWGTDPDDEVPVLPFDREESAAELVGSALDTVTVRNLVP